MNAVASAPEQIAASPRFIDNGDGMVTDSKSGLQWSATLTSQCVTHAAAEKVCAELSLGGHKDWRMPTVEELFLLADRSRHNPAIDTDAFPDTQSDWYWSSTIHAASSGHAWVVNFSNGGAGDSHRDYGYAFVRAVRSAAPGQ